MKSHLVRRILLAFFLLLSPPALSQWLTFDAVNSVIQQAIQALQNPSFKALVGGVEDLKKITGAIQQFHRGIELINTVQRAINKMNALSQLASADNHIRAADFTGLSAVMSSISEDGTSILKDAKSGLSTGINLIKMTDGERMAWLDEANKKANRFERTIDLLLHQLKKLSLSRSLNQKDMDATFRLYGVVINRANQTANKGQPGQYWASVGNVYATSGNVDPSVLDNYNNTPEAQTNRKALLDYQIQLQEYQLQLDLFNAQYHQMAADYLLSPAGGFIPNFDPNSHNFNGYKDTTTGLVYSDAQMEARVNLEATKLSINAPNRPQPPPTPSFK